MDFYSLPNLRAQPRARNFKLKDAGISYFTEMAQGKMLSKLPNCKLTIKLKHKQTHKYFQHYVISHVILTISTWQSHLTTQKDQSLPWFIHIHGPAPVKSSIPDRSTCSLTCSLSCQRKLVSLEIRPPLSKNPLSKGRF